MNLVYMEFVNEKAVDVMIIVTHIDVWNGKAVYCAKLFHMYMDVNFYFSLCTIKSVCRTIIFICSGHGGAAVYMVLLSTDSKTR